MSTDTMDETETTAEPTTYKQITFSTKRLKEYLRIAHRLITRDRINRDKPEQQWPRGHGSV